MKRSLGVCYYPEHWPEEIWALDAQQMVETGLTWVRIGEFAWSRLEPQPGQFDWGWLDRAIATLGTAGLKVILGTPTATPPRWMLDKYPDMLARNSAARSANLARGAIIVLATQPTETKPGGSRASWPNAMARTPALRHGRPTMSMIATIQPLAILPMPNTPFKTGAPSAIKAHKRSMRLGGMCFGLWNMTVSTSWICPIKP